MKVPLIDLSGQHQFLRPKLLDAVARVIDSQQFVLGFEVASLEEELANYSTTNFAIGCASGSDALLLALMALDIQAGDEVITTPFTFFATGSATHVSVRGLNSLILIREPTILIRRWLRR